MPKKVSSQKDHGEEVVDFKEMYKNKKRKEVKHIEKSAQKKAKENPRAPKDFTCPYCAVTISGWVVCRHHIFAKHGVVATRAELLSNTLPPATTAPQRDAEEDESEDEEHSNEKDHTGMSDSDSDSNSNSDEEGESRGESGGEDSAEEEGWIANAKNYWTQHLENIEEESERKVSTQQIFDKNSKKKFRPEFMSKKEYVRRVIEAMKEDAAFEFDAVNNCFTSVAVDEEELGLGEDEDEEDISEDGEVDGSDEDDDDEEE